MALIRELRSLILPKCFTKLLLQLNTPIKRKRQNQLRSIIVFRGDRAQLSSSRLHADERTLMGERTHARKNIFSFHDCLHGLGLRPTAHWFLLLVTFVTFCFCFG